MVLARTRSWSRPPPSQKGLYLGGIDLLMTTESGACSGGKISLFLQEGVQRRRDIGLLGMYSYFFVSTGNEREIHQS